MQWQAIECSVAGDGFGHPSILCGWRAINKKRPVLFFLHGNGFCGRIYEPFLAHFAADFELFVLDAAGHGGSGGGQPYAGWNATARHCTAALDQSADWIDGRDVIAVGHSMGAVLQILMSARRENIFTHMVLLDPILFPRKLLATFWILRLIGLMDRLHPMVRVTQKRRSSWPSKELARDYFKQRGIYKNWVDLALDNYVEFGLREKSDGLQHLCCEPALEARIFGSWPKRLWRSIGKLRCPVSLYMGRDSFAFALTAAETAASGNGNIQRHIVPGNHCFMLENPAQAAQAVASAVLGKTRS